MPIPNHGHPSSFDLLVDTVHEARFGVGSAAIRDQARPTGSCFQCAGTGMAAGGKFCSCQKGIDLAAQAFRR